MSIRHRKVSNKEAPVDPSKIGGPDWNDDHVTAVDSSNVSATSYTLTEADHNAVRRFTASSSIVVTVPTGLPAGFSCVLLKAGTGSLNVVPASGAVTLAGSTSVTGSLDSITILSAPGSNSFDCLSSVSESSGGGGASPLTVTGATQVGQTISATLAQGWSAESFSWTRNGSPIAGADSQDYLLTTEDGGQELAPTAHGLSYTAPAVAIEAESGGGGDTSVLRTTGGEQVWGNSLSLSFGGTPVAPGNGVIVAFKANVGLVNSVSDNASPTPNTYTLAHTATVASDGDGAAMYIYHCANVQGNPTSVTISLTGNSGIGGRAAEVVGLGAVADTGGAIVGATTDTWSMPFDAAQPDSIVVGLINTLDAAIATGVDPVTAVGVISGAGSSEYLHFFIGVFEDAGAQNASVGFSPGRSGQYIDVTYSPS